MTLNDMRQILAEEDIMLTKSLGQNFLHDANIQRRILAAGALVPGDKVLEIGPGLGPLTEKLVTQVGEVLAIEKDRRLATILERRMANTPGLELRVDDALDYIERERRDWSDWKLVANLPYSAASPILVALALSPGAPVRIAVTLQLEVARRLWAAEDTEEYGLLTLLIQQRYTLREWFKIPPSCFFPEPGGDSACITLERRAKELLDEVTRKRFVRLVKVAFSQRRKMMRKLLKAAWKEPAIDAAYATCGLDARVRAEAVSLEKFIQMTRTLPDPE